MPDDALPPMPGLPEPPDPGGSALPPGTYDGKVVMVTGGGTGLGKTHLLQAVGQYVGEHGNGLTARYVTSETFMNDFINSLRDKRIEGFKQRYRTYDVLLVDDVHDEQRAWRAPLCRGGMGGGEQREGEQRGGGGEAAHG